MKTWNYKVTIYTKDDTIIIQNPIGCRGTITRSVLCESNKASIDLYNLALSTREKIFQEPYLMAENPNSKAVKIEVGYSEDGSVQQVFYGRILQAYSMKSSGSTEVVTRIEAICLDLFNTSSVTFDIGTTYKDAIKRLQADFPNLISNALGAINGSFKTPTTFEGNTLEQINKIAGGGAFIDNNTINAILNTEVIDVPVPIISNDTVLLDTPIRKEMQLDINFIMQPSLQVGQLLEINSKIFPSYNGQYKVLGFTHSFLISESVAGQKTTKATLYCGSALPLSQTNTTGEEKAVGFSKVKKEQVTPIGHKNAANIYEVYKYIKNNNGKIPDTYITRSISWVEMLGHSNTPQQRLSNLTISDLANCFATATNLQRIIDKKYPGRGIEVTSGWRSPKVNKDFGGVSNSKHLNGLAIDFHINGVSIPELEAYMLATWSGSIGYVYKSVKKGFVHVQVDSKSRLVNDV